MRFRQRDGIDFDDICSPVVKMVSIRMILGLAGNLSLEVEQMDMNISFLHGDGGTNLHGARKEEYV
jgi:ATP-binding cassette subfamily B (MDR/TAP) protein 1